jgi:hypothetical protein
LPGADSDVPRGTEFVPDVDGQAVLQPGHRFCTGCFVEVKLPLPPRYRVEGGGWMNSKPATTVRSHVAYLAQGGMQLIQQLNADNIQAAMPRQLQLASHLDITVLLSPEQHERFLIIIGIMNSIKPRSYDWYI